MPNICGLLRAGGKSAMRSPETQRTAWSEYNYGVAINVLQVAGSYPTETTANENRKATLCRSRQCRDDKGKRYVQWRLLLTAYTRHAGTLSFPYLHRIIQG